MTRSVAFLLLAGALASCAGEVIPEEFSRGQTIPFGAHTLKVYRVQPNPLGNSLILSVYVRIDPEGGGDAPLDTKWVSYLRKLKLTDGAEEEHRAVGAMPAAIEHARRRMVGSDPGSFAREMRAFEEKMEEMLSSGSLPPEWDEWVVVFHVAAEAKPFTLHLDNPDPKDDQPRAVFVRVYR